MLALLASAVLLDASAAAPDTRTLQRTEAVTTYLNELREAAELPGISAGLVFPDGSELTVAVGYASLEGETPLRSGDLLLSGSIGKTYVAAAALELVHAGKLSLDDHLAAHLGEREWFERLPNGGALTLRHLLRHQSGLARYVYAPEFAEALVQQPDKVWAPEELVAFVLDRPPLFEAGAAFAYSDTNYILVGMVLEEVTRERFYDRVAAHLLEPLGLSATLPSDRRELPGLVQGYDQIFREWGLPERVIGADGRFVINPQFEWCGGGYANTPLDLARWARLLYSGKAFDGPYLAWMLDTVPAPQLGPEVRYGPALMLRETDLGEFRGHDGIMTGYSSSMGYFADLDIAVAVQTNASRPRTFGKPGHEVLVDLARLVGAGEGR